MTDPQIQQNKINYSTENNNSANFFLFFLLKRNSKLHFYSKVHLSARFLPSDTENRHTDI